MTSVADRPTGTPDLQVVGIAEQEVARLRKTFASGRTRPYAWRRRQLEGIVKLVTEREADLATALASDLGRTPHETWFGDVASTVGEAEYAIKHLKKWMRSTRTSVPLALMPGKAKYHYEPLGTVLVIGPWNYPIYLTSGPWPPATASSSSRRSTRPRPRRCWLT
jgi:aldehyde dehydrogenase (NAD+)